MNVVAVYPAAAHSAYKIAAKTFASLAKQVAGVSVQTVTDDEYSNYKVVADLTVLIGNDAVNSVTAKIYLENRTEGFGIRYCTDDYCIRTVNIDGRCFTFLVGGRPRATIYAVYRYFDLFCGCRWFWDGDRIEKTELPRSGINIVESPRFDYRGIRYFAHRSLHRFQAEHWSFEDWTREIDWLLKKRLNLFMLRIGMDDLFQKAFPDIVSYPDRDQRLPEAGQGFNDRTLFWSLEYRGELRKKILQYAFERDLIHPEDCGTMSHWYSRTPLDFINKAKPNFLPQSNDYYRDLTGFVWDVRNRKDFDNYCKLTDTHIKEYGSSEMFHTIGLGERLYSDDRELNRRMKLYVYRKIATYVKENYPNSPLLISSWDLWKHYSPEEVRDLVLELDPSQSIILDYTSDTTKDNNFTNWGVLNKFPWMFGMFVGYEPDSEIRGFYELTNERLKLAKDDPMCKGMIIWPELSHSDTFALEYFAYNAWERETPSLEEQVDRYCRDRYPSELVAEISDIWHSFLPIVQLAAWSIDEERQQTTHDIFTDIIERANFENDKAGEYKGKAALAAKYKDTAAHILIRLSKLTVVDKMTERDMYDIARTIIARYINTAILYVEYLYAAGAQTEELDGVMRISERLLGLLTDLLGTHDDYSMFASLAKLRDVTETNPNFEQTLKENSECYYCRSGIYENAKCLYIPEMKLLYSEVKKSVENNELLDKKVIIEGKAEIRRRYFNTPLATVEKPTATFSDILVKAAKVIGNINI